MVSFRGRKVHPWRLVIMLILTPVLVGLVWVSGWLAFDPILDQIDKNKVENMDHDMRSILANLNSGARELGVYNYQKGCELVYSTWAGPSQSYVCSVSIRVGTTVQGPSYALRSHELFYPLVEKSSLLEATSSLQPGPLSTFGEKYIGSAIERNYKLPRSGAMCIYATTLSHLKEPYGGSYGAEIKGVGVVESSLQCSIFDARGDWL